MNEHLKMPLLQNRSTTQGGGSLNPQPAPNQQKHSCAFCPERGADMSERMETASLFDMDGRRKYLNADERERFISAASSFSPQTHALALLLHCTGCRISEALSVRSVHLDPAEDIVILQTLKQRRRGAFRMMPLPGRVMNMLLGFNETTDAPLIAMHRSTAWEKITTVMAKAGISGPQATPRGTRHGFGVAAVSAGVPITLVQRWLGHARLETTSIYLAVTGPEEREYAAKLWRKSNLIQSRQEAFA